MFNQKTFTADHVRLTSIEVFSLQRRVPLIGQTCASRKFMVFIKPGKKFGGHSWFLCFANLVWCIWWTATKLYLGSKKLCSTCSGSICPVWQTFTLTGWEQREFSCGQGKQKWMPVSKLYLLWRELICLLACQVVGGTALSLGHRKI